MTSFVADQCAEVMPLLQAVILIEYKRRSVNDVPCAGIIRCTRWCLSAEDAA